MYAVAALLTAASFCAMFVRGASPGALGAAMRFVDRPAQLALVMNGVPTGALPHAVAPELTQAVISGFATTALAIAFAAVALFGHRLPAALVSAARAPGVAVEALRAVHDGVVTDYIAWLTAGTMTFGIAAALLMR